MILTTTAKVHCVKMPFYLIIPHETVADKMCVCVFALTNKREYNNSAVPHYTASVW